MGIRLVCSDLDGTLLQYGKKELEGEIFDQIRALHDRGILFCPASGRQYTSLRKLFAPVADCCIFLCENGGVIYKDELCIAKNSMPRALAEEIAEDLWSRSDGQGEVMLSRTEYGLSDGTWAGNAGQNKVYWQQLSGHSGSFRNSGRHRKGLRISP